MLETVRRTPPQSAAELAERTGRKKPNLSRTLKTMEQYGLVQINRRKRKLVPGVRYQRVAVLMELRGSSGHETSSPPLSQKKGRKDRAPCTHHSDYC